MSEENNPYAPPPIAKAEPSQLEPAIKERLFVRALSGFIALCFFALLMTMDFRRLNFGLIAVLAMSTYGCLAFGFVAVTGRWLAFRRWFR